MRITWLAAVVAAACGGDIDIGDDVDTDADTEPAPIGDLSLAGPSAVAEGQDSMQVSEGCTLEYTRYRPDESNGDALVILSHGFLRSPAQVDGWARQWASWGVEVVTPQLCFLRLVDTDHPANGASLATLAERLADGRPVVLAGHSAGGLASFLAAEQVADASVLLLDGTDSDGLGEGAASGVVGTVGALFAEPSACNGDGNGEAMVAPAPDREAWRISGSDHCDYENPTDRLCTALCRGGGGDRDAIAGVIRGMTTGFVLWQGGVDPRGEQYWRPGEAAYDGNAALLEVP